MSKKKAAKTLAQEKVIFLLSLPWMKMCSWGFFLLLVYAMRSFFTVVFLTFLLSYMACNVVNRFSKEDAKWDWLRKLVVVFTFTIFFVIAYWGGRFIIPNIVEQGEGVVKIVKKVGLDRNFQTFIPDTYADWQYEMYRSSKKYKDEFNKRLKEVTTLEGKGLKQFKQDAEELRKEFRDQQVAKEGNRLYKDFERSDGFEKQYSEWLEKTIHEEIFLPDKDKLIKDYEYKSFGNSKKKQKERIEQLGLNYDKYIEAMVMGEITDAMTTDKKAEYKERFKNEWIKTNSQKYAAALEKQPSWEKDFKIFYESKKRGYPFDKFIQLEKVKTEEDFVKLTGKKEAEKKGKQAVENGLKKELVKQYKEDIKQKLDEVGIYKSINEMAASILPRIFNWLRLGIGSVLSFGFDLILSVFLSFVIVWDLPQIKRGLKKLSKSRMKKLYEEIVPGLVSFGALLGRSFQARVGIAFVNTAILLLIMLFTSIEKQVFLATIVFVGSFVPVVGVVISGVPILLLSLQAGGIFLALKMFIAIIGVTIFESLVLDPKIMGEVLNLHALLVLVVLTLGGHYFGIWGVLLCVPVAVYIIQDVIMSGEDKNGKESEDLPEVKPVVNKTSD